MRIPANSVEEYLEAIPKERKAAFNKLRNGIIKNLPENFEECLSYGMIGYVVPLSVYPDGYHCKADTPLPFMSIANQKKFVALYHMGIYSKPELLDWFTSEYPKHCERKLDMGKSCIRFKKMDDIPFELINELTTKMSAQQWIDIYEENIKK